MKLLFDENLSRRLASSLSDLYPDSTHVTLAGLQEASDTEIWRYASAHGFAIVSKDSDFRHRAASSGGVKVILVDTGNRPTAAIARLLRESYEGIVEFDASDEALLVLGFQ